MCLAFDSLAICTSGFAGNAGEDLCEVLAGGEAAFLRDSGDGAVRRPKQVPRSVHAQPIQELDRRISCLLPNEICEARPAKLARCRHVLKRPRFVAAPGKFTLKVNQPLVCIVNPLMTWPSGRTHQVDQFKQHRTCQKYRPV